MFKNLKNKLENTMMAVDNKRLDLQYKINYHTPKNFVDAVDDLAYATDKVKNKIKKNK